jgi:hypothetical protein
LPYDHHEDSLCFPRTIPNSGVRFSDKITHTKEGSRAPKGALSNQCPRKARLRAFVSPVLRFLQERIGEGARRLSALTLAALATGFYPDGSAPEPGFPRLWLAGFARFARRCRS